MIKESHKYKGRMAIDVAGELNMEIDDFLDDLFDTGYYCCHKCGEIVDVEQLGDKLADQCNKCESKKRFLKAGDKVVVEHAEFKVNERQMFEHPFIGDSTIWHDGLEVSRDEETGQLYVEE